jgi:hypothetical protein
MRKGSDLKFCTAGSTFLHGSENSEAKKIYINTVQATEMKFVKEAEGRVIRLYKLQIKYQRAITGVLNFRNCVKTTVDMC